MKKPNRNKNKCQSNNADGLDKLETPNKVKANDQTKGLLSYDCKTSLNGLFPIPFGIPTMDEDYSLVDDGSKKLKKTQLIAQTAKELTKELQLVNRGGCAMVATMLDSLFDGQICAITYESEYGEIARPHLFFLCDGYCYDSEHVSSYHSIAKKFDSDFPISKEKFGYCAKPNHLYIVKGSPQEVFYDYGMTHYNPLFANRFAMKMLYDNYKQIIKNLSKYQAIKPNMTKVNLIIYKYNFLLQQLPNILYH
jgi:hypothetical protein